MVHSFNFFFSCVMTKIWWKIAVHILLHHRCELSVFSVSVLKRHMKHHYYSSVSLVKYHSVSHLLCTFSTPVEHKNSDTWVRNHYWTIWRHTNGYTCNQVSFFACCTCLTWYSLVAAFILVTPCLPLNWKKVCYILQSLTKLLNKKLNFSIWCTIIIMVFYVFFISFSLLNVS
jgi:hypothetical protein